MIPDWETLIPVLVHIQANLDGDLSLPALSKKAGLSAFHFQRLFKAAVGETPKGYTLRLRLERAAFHLMLHDGNLLHLAIGCGFHNHESFCRAFRRRFSCSPSEYRESARRRVDSRCEQIQEVQEVPSQCFEISATRVVQVRSMHVAFVRHVGPYESVPDTIFEELEQWAARRRLSGPPVWLGIGHDSPGITPPEQLRFDAAIRVPAPLASEGRVGYQLLPGGHFALTTHVGPYETFTAAYEIIFKRLFTLAGYGAIGLPAIEIYHTAKVNPGFRLNHTDIYLPVERLCDS